MNRTFGLRRASGAGSAARAAGAAAPSDRLRASSVARRTDMGLPSHGVEGASGHGCINPGGKDKLRPAPPPAKAQATAPQAVDAGLPIDGPFPVGKARPAKFSL